MRGRIVPVLVHRQGELVADDEGRLSFDDEDPVRLNVRLTFPRVTENNEPSQALAAVAFVSCLAPRLDEISVDDRLVLITPITLMDSEYRIQSCAGGHKIFRLGLVSNRRGDLTHGAV